MKFLFLLVLIACTRPAPQKPAEQNSVIWSFAPETAVFHVRSTLPYISKVADVGNCIVKKPEFLAEVAAFPKYDYTTMSPTEVAHKLKEFHSVTLSTYWKPVTKSIAYTVKNTTYFNTARNPRPIPEMANTAIHEWTHVLGFGHGDNWSKGKENSVPYRVGSIAEKYVGGCL
jgi:hypothetical protein